MNSTYTIIGIHAASGRLFETTVAATGPANALRAFARKHPRASFLSFKKA